MYATNSQKIIIFHGLTRSSKCGNREPAIQVCFTEYLFQKFYKILSEQNNGNSFENLPSHGYFLL